MNTGSFASRHIGPGSDEIQSMLQTIGVDSVDTLIEQTVPANIRLKGEMNLPTAMTEHQYLVHVQQLARKNKVFKSYIGMGYHNTVMPSVIQRNILENPGWYTAYTPYQAEIAQGRLEALLNFQTMVTDLTGMELANASLLDESTAAAEAMGMFYAARSRDQVKAEVHNFFVDEGVHPQNLDLLKTRATPLGINLVVGNPEVIQLDQTFFGALLQYPTSTGAIVSPKPFIEKAQAAGVRVAVAADIMSLVLLESPGSMGADCVVGTTQRFGIPLGYGGPHAAFFATREEFKRHIPGRIIGQTIDASGKPALRMALQTREQHIKRDKATSNICTAQVLLAVMAGMYGVYHGKAGLKRIASRIHHHTVTLADGIAKLGYAQLNEGFFDTLFIDLGMHDALKVKSISQERGYNFRHLGTQIGISLNETTDIHAVNEVLAILADAKGLKAPVYNQLLEVDAIPAELARSSAFLTHPVFNSYHSETDMMRYIKKLERKDLSLNHSMIPLGSCTMKLNAASEMIPLSWPSFANIHPFAPVDQAEGYQQIIQELEVYLAEITGFDAVSLQPNSGAQGEYAGLMVIRAYHEDRGEGHRNKILIPSSAHGTNPASAVMAGYDVVVVACDAHGNIDVADLKAKAELHSSNLAGLMITYPSTHGVFESAVIEITDVIHQHGGQVYMDGANMNAQVGLTSPGRIGADVCHLNLHKTFAIPHGGGGPGMGPICVKSQLAPFLPSNPTISTGGNKAISAISAAPWGSSLILLISYGYIRMLDKRGLTDSTKLAILNANYLKALLGDAYPVLYAGENGRVAHEMIVDCREFKRTAGIEVVDIAKRLMDYGYHAPTVSFPVAGTLMIEPTESESKVELDRFASAMLQIRSEIEEIASGKVDATNNPLKNAPHTLELVSADAWDLPYPRSKAAYPL